jgi:hypothetical protein
MVNLEFFTWNIDLLVLWWLQIIIFPDRQQKHSCFCYLVQYQPWKQVYIMLHFTWLYVSAGKYTAPVSSTSCTMYNLYRKKYKKYSLGDKQGWEGSLLFCISYSC